VTGSVPGVYNLFLRNWSECCDNTVNRKSLLLWRNNYAGAVLPPLTAVWCDIAGGGGRRALTTTRPGNWLKGAIPVRTFVDWQENKPGFLEADLVLFCHCSGLTWESSVNVITSLWR